MGPSKRELCESAVKAHPQHAVEKEKSNQFQQFDGVIGQEKGVK
jgi:hypothetical protein